MIQKIVFCVVLLLCLVPQVNPPMALLLGIILSQTIGVPFPDKIHTGTKILLQCSVVGLGFSMNLYEAAKAGQEGLIFTIVSISSTLIGGVLLGKLFKIESKTAYLISTGTAICGGSAIAAVSPVIKAERHQMSVALAIVFILNSAALLIFPVIGKSFHLSAHDFGLWAAIAIHDTSSVVGAAQTFGTEAVQIATTVKLERALWIIPVSILSVFLFKGGQTKAKIPWFILYYVIAMALNTFIPEIHPASDIIVPIAKKGLTVTLFLIGSGLSRDAIRSVGIKPFLLGILLWIFISVTSLIVILHH